MSSSITCSGSIALDTTRTPFKTVENVLGGAVSYFSISASFFSKVYVNGIVGTDFPQEYWELLKKHSDLAGVQKKEGKTFHYDCTYSFDFYHRQTNLTELNVLADFKPKVTEEAKNSEFVYLATMPPLSQRDVLKQVTNKKLSFMDTIEFFIDKQNGFYSELLETISMVDGLILNDSEARKLTNETNLVKCINKITELGPEIIILKKGEHGCLLYYQKKIYPFPAFPLETIVDPNGAGDAFAGGFIGALAKENATNPGIDQLKSAIGYATVMGSLAVSDFSVNELIKAKKEQIEGKFIEYRELLRV